MHNNMSNIDQENSFSHSYMNFIKNNHHSRKPWKTLLPKQRYYGTHTTSNIYDTSQGNLNLIKGMITISRHLIVP